MSVATEIERIQTAKETLKTKLNAKNDSEHQITNELISDYGTFVDSITGGDINEYFKPTIQGGDVYGNPGWSKTLLKFRSPLIVEGTNGYNMFNNYAFDTAPALIGAEKLTSAMQMFYTSNYLKYVQDFDTSNVTNMYSMFQSCSNLITVPKLNASKVIVVSNIFGNCNNLTNLGGLENLGQAYDTTKSANYSSYTLDLSTSKKLTHDSLMNVINNLYDIKSKGCNPQSLVLGSTNLAKLTAEEIAIATNKGWNVS